MATQRYREACPHCPIGFEHVLGEQETMCAACRTAVLAECDCGATYFEIEAFRILPLDQVLRLDDSTKLEIRACRPCGGLLGVRINQDGRPLPAEEPMKSGSGV